MIINQTNNESYNYSTDNITINGETSNQFYTLGEISPSTDEGFLGCINNLGSINIISEANVIKTLKVFNGRDATIAVGDLTLTGDPKQYTPRLTGFLADNGIKVNCSSYRQILCTA